MNSSIKDIFFFLAFLFSSKVTAQPFTHQDTLRGSITPERVWWDLNYYDLAIDVDIDNKFIRGTNTVYFYVLFSQQKMQIDLQEPLVITKVVYEGKELAYSKEGNAYWIVFPYPLTSGARESITISYEGKPVEAVRPPWDGGFTWTSDDVGNPFVATSCQGLGASIWWPCKDHMYDEPDSMLMRITVPASLTDVSNGRLRHIDYLPDGKKTFHWFVSNPINNYGVNVNIGKYAHWADTLHGEKGILDLDFYVLEDNYEKARTHFQDAYRTIRAFEYWFGPYPFYEDGYKLVEVPYLGMEHQSSVTYGNKYTMGYLGKDLSSTGWGLKFDFIIVHESGHEWWANNITYKDIADMWIHESFTNYSESLFLDYYYGKKAASEYVIGTRASIANNKPIIGPYGVNQKGSGDMYSKGGNMLHTLRTWLNDDVKWRAVLRGLQQEFFHQTVTTEQIESYMAQHTGLSLASFFDQYLRDTRIPTVEYELKGKKLKYRYANVVDDFTMPVEAMINGTKKALSPTAMWQTITEDKPIKTFILDENYYVLQRNIH
jgi:aminopeptidase N